MTSTVRNGGGACALWAPSAHSGLKTIAAPAYLIVCWAAAEPPADRKAEAAPLGTPCQEAIAWQQMLMQILLP